MSYQQCIFGVPSAKVSQAMVLDRVAEAMSDLSGDLELPDIVVAVDDEARARESELRCFIIGARPPRDRQITREPVFERLAYGEQDWPVVEMIHDDQHGIYLFKGPGVRLASDGPYLGGNLDKLTIDYPQKGLPHEALGELEDYSNALSLGLRQFFPRRKRDYLDLLYTKTLWHVFPAETARKVPGDQPWANVVSPYFEDLDWRLAKLEPRRI